MEGRLSDWRWDEMGDEWEIVLARRGSMIATCGKITTQDIKTQVDALLDGYDKIELKRIIALTEEYPKEVMKR
jgi:hypothetical protein